MPDNFFAETEQVAFMTQNVPPGIDFSNDPLLQGRNFSYLDTQIKRLGSQVAVEISLRSTAAIRSSAPETKPSGIGPITDTAICWRTYEPARSMI
jgi:hypothetical protein